MKILEHEKEIEVIAQYDVVICGGGIAGISAALASARTGAKVLLIEREYALGGLATLGLVTIYLPLCDGMGRQVSFGIAEELLRLSVEHGCEEERNTAWLDGMTLEERQKRRFEVRYNPHVFAIKAEQLLLDEGVSLLYGTSICAVQTTQDKITHVIIENKSGRQAIAFKSIVDATGDADICCFANEETVKHTKGNILAGWSYTVEDGKYNLNMLGFCDTPDWNKTEKKSNEPDKRPRYTGLDGLELTEYMIESHKVSLSKFLSKGDGSKEHALATIPTIPQVRMTRRIAGVYTQDENEMHKQYDDSVGLFSDWRRRGPVYELPFRCLFGNKYKNLITAGRCISSSEAMWDVTRVIPVCAVSGQAAGTAAALTDDFANLDIRLLQKQLISDGVILHES